jgi:hypothetical protein
MSLAFLENPVFWVFVALASELIALSPLKSNSIIQLVLSALRSIQKNKQRE